MYSKKLSVYVAASLVGISALVLFAGVLLVPHTVAAQSSCVAPVPAITVTLYKKPAAGMTATERAQTTALQNFLIAEGFLEAGNNTGNFGAVTQAAVGSWQIARGVLPASADGDVEEGWGQVGPSTRNAMNRCVSPTTTSNTGTGTGSGTGTGTQTGTVATTPTTPSASQGVTATLTMQPTAHPRTFLATVNMSNTCAGGTYRLAHGTTAAYEFTIPAGQCSHSFSRTLTFFTDMSPLHVGLYEMRPSIYTLATTVITYESPEQGLSVFVPDSAEPLTVVVLGRDLCPDYVSPTVSLGDGKSVQLRGGDCHHWGIKHTFASPGTYTVSYTSPMGSRGSKTITVGEAGSQCPSDSTLQGGVCVQPEQSNFTVVENGGVLWQTEAKVGQKDLILASFQLKSNLSEDARLFNLGFNTAGQSGSESTSPAFMNVRVKIGNQTYPMVLITWGMDSGYNFVASAGSGYHRNYAAKFEPGAVLPKGVSTQVQIVADAPSAATGYTFSMQQGSFDIRSSSGARVPTVSPNPTQNSSLVHQSVQFKTSLNTDSAVSKTADQPVAATVYEFSETAAIKLSVKNNGTVPASIKTITLRSTGSANDKVMREIFVQGDCTFVQRSPLFGANRTAVLGGNASHWANTLCTVAPGKTVTFSIIPYMGTDAEIVSELGKTVSFEVTDIQLLGAPANPTGTTRLPGLYPLMSVTHTIGVEGGVPSCTISGPAQVNVGSDYNLTWTGKNGTVRTFGGTVFAPNLPGSGVFAGTFGTIGPVRSNVVRTDTWKLMVTSPTGVERTCETTVQIVASGATSAKVRAYLDGTIPSRVTQGTSNALFGRVVFDQSAGSMSVSDLRLKLTGPGSSPSLDSCVAEVPGVGMKGWTSGSGETMTIRFTHPVLIGAGAAGSIDIRCSASGLGSYKLELLDFNSTVSNNDRSTLPVDTSFAPANANPIITVAPSNLVTIPSSALPATPPSGPAMVCYPTSVAPGGLISAMVYGQSSKPHSDWANIVRVGAESWNNDRTSFPLNQYIPAPRPATITFTAPTSPGVFIIQGRGAGATWGVDGFFPKCEFTVTGAATASSFDYTVSPAENELEVIRGATGPSDPNYPRSGAQAPASQRITVTKTSGLGAPVDVQITNLPTGVIPTYQTTVTAGTSANIVTTQDKATCKPDASCQVVVSFVANTAAPVGKIPVTISASSGSVSRSSSFTLNIRDIYDITLSPASGVGGTISVAQGASVTNVITVTRGAGDTGSVYFAASGVTGSQSLPLPSGISASFSPSSCTPNPTCSTTLTLTASASALRGVSQIQVRGQTQNLPGGSLSKTTFFKVDVSGTQATTASTNISTTSSTPTTPIATTTGTTGATATTGTTQTTSASVVQATAQTTATSYRGKNGTEVTFACPAGVTISSVWGTGTYTDDSRVCTAGIHMGVITQAAGGNVTIRIGGSQSSYTSSTQNGVKSNAYGAWSWSFTVVTGTQAQNNAERVAQLAAALAALENTLKMFMNR